jgi:ATP-dependent exoDNAse (exonuclease V) alpha subunit
MISFCFPADLMLRPLENVDLIKNHCILAPLRTTVAQLNDRIRCLIPESYSQTEVLHALDHRVHAPTGDDPTDVNAAQRDIEYIHNRTPSGFPPYELRLKVGMICVMNYNYDPRAHLFNGTRVQILQIQRNLLKVKVLTGNSGHIAYIGRRKFEYGRKRSEPGIPFTRTQYPLEPGFCMTVNKSQGQTLDRVGVDLTSRQCFSHGMLYTALSRVRSASSLQILSGLGNKAVNVVDLELIRGADVDLHGDAEDAPTPAQPPPNNGDPPPNWSALEDDVFME